jgi:hypothetical protein
MVIPRLALAARSRLPIFSILDGSTSGPSSTLNLGYNAFGYARLRVMVATQTPWQNQRAAYP